MTIPIGGFLIIFGIAWAALILIFLVLGVFPAPGVTLPWYSYALWFSPGLLTIPGVILVVIGLVKRKKDKAKAKEIYSRGIKAQARVTFVDKNYTLLVNEKPIYSIIECVFNDSSGMPHTVRKENVDSDLVIRNQIFVGGIIDVMYLAENPDDTIFLLKDLG